MTANGCKAATTDPAQIQAWWAKTPDANIGIATGRTSGLGVLDVDRLKGGDESLAKLIAVVGELPDTLASATGGGGNHYMFALGEGVVVKNAAGYAGFKGIDLRGEGGYIVAPPSMHASGKAYAWCAGSAEKLAPVPAWMTDASFLKGRSEAVVTPASAPVLGHRPSAGRDWVVEALHGLAEGNRNGTFVKVAGRLHQQGATPGEIVAYLAPWAEKAGTSMAELNSVISSVTRYSRSQSFQDSDLGLETETKGPIEVHGLQSFLGKHIPQHAWLIQDVIPACGIGLIAGQENLGKTWLVLDLALALASGTKWLGQHETRKAKVLVIDEEGVPFFQQWRLRGMAEFSRLDASAMDFNLILNEDIRFTHGPSLARLMPVLEEYRPDFVIVDSLVRVFGGDENSSQDVSRLFKVVKALAQKYQVTFLFTDHHRKGLPGATGWNQMVRGSSDKMAAVDFAFAVQKDEDELVLHNTKARYSHRLEPFKVKLVEQDDGHVVVSYTGIAKDSKATGAVLALTPVMEDLLPAEGSISRQEVVAAAKTNGISEKDVTAALKSMVKERTLVLTAMPPKSGKGNKRFVYQWGASTTGEA